MELNLVDPSTHDVMRIADGLSRRADELSRVATGKDKVKVVGAVGGVDPLDPLLKGRHLPLHACDLLRRSPLWQRSRPGGVDQMLRC